MKGKKFNFLKALGDYNLTNAETATLTAMWNHADADTGYLWANLAQINEWCSRAPKSGRTPEHIKKAEALGLLTIGGHGRSRNYTLNFNIKPIPKSSNKSSTSSKSSTSKSSTTADKDLQDGGLTPPLRRTNTSTNTSKEETNMKRNLLKEMVEDSKGEVPLDYIPQRVWNDNFPDLLREAKLRYNFLVSLGVKKNLPFEDKHTQRWFIDWSQTSDPLFETAVLLMGKPTMKDLVKTPFGKLWRSVENQKFSELGAREEQEGFELLNLLFNLQRYKWDNPNHPLLNNYRKWFESKKVSV